MKKAGRVCVVVILLIIFNACGNKNVIQNQSIDDLYNKIKQYDFDDFDLIDLNYDQINQTKIIVGEQSFGSRDLLVDENDLSTQRILCYSSKNDTNTQVNIILGEMPVKFSIANNMITLYSDNLKKIGLSDSKINELNIWGIESSIFLVGNVLINVASINSNPELDIPIAKLREQLVKVLI